MTAARDGAALARRALELAADPAVDKELAAGDLLQDSDADQDALDEARSELRRLTEGGDGVARRAAEILRIASDVGYGGE